MPPALKLRPPMTKVTLAPRIVQASIAGEVVAQFGGTARAVDISQRGVYGALLKEIHIIGLDSDGRRRATVVFEFNPDGIHQISVDENEERSMTARLCGGLSAAVEIQSDRFRRLGLTPDVYYFFHDEIRNDPERHAAAMAELGVHLQAIPDWADGYEGHDVLSVSPSGSGIMARFQQAFRKTSQ